MQKKDFLIPGTVIVLAVAIGIWLIVHSISPIAAILPPTSTSSPAMQVATTTHATTAPAKPVGGYYPYGSVTLALNQVAGFKDGLSVRPTAVLEDSRCPQDVQCIQAGTVRITLKTSTTNSSENHDVALGKEFTVGGDDITFVSVTPPHTKNGAPESSTYRFTFRIAPHVSVGTGIGNTQPCYIGGCSAELCSDSAGAVSSCIYRSEYACYKTATCERQSTGKCGWTQSKELLACLQTPSTAH